MKSTKIASKVMLPSIIMSFIALSIFTGYLFVIVDLNKAQRIVVISAVLVLGGFFAPLIAYIMKSWIKKLDKFLDFSLSDFILSYDKIYHSALNLPFRCVVLICILWLFSLIVGISTLFLFGVINFILSLYTMLGGIFIGFLYAISHYFIVKQLIFPITHQIVREQPEDFIPKTQFKWLNIKFKLIFTICVLVFTAIIFSTLINITQAGHIIRNFMQEHIEAAAKDSFQEIEDIINAGGNLEEVNQYIASNTDESHFFIIILDKDGNLLSEQNILSDAQLVELKKIIIGKIKSEQTQLIVVERYYPKYDWNIIAINKSNQSHITLFRKLIIYSLGNFLFIVILIIVIVTLLTNEISHPISLITSAVHKIESGDLRENIAILSEDEIGAMAHNLYKMVKSIRLIIAQVSDAANEVSSTSEELFSQIEFRMEKTGEFELARQTLLAAHLHGGIDQCSELSRRQLR